MGALVRNSSNQFSTTTIRGGDWAPGSLRVATKNGREALALALTDMIRDGEVSPARAEEIATMVMRSNAATLYKLGLK